ncbi:28053_t:CDS:1, partial [Racocetra persica]
SRYVRKMARKTESILPHSNYVQDGSTSTILADAKDNPNNAKKSFVKRIRRFMKLHCNKSRIILLIIFLITISAIITIFLILNKNPFVLIRPLCKSQFGMPSLNQTFTALAKLETNQVDDSSISYTFTDSSGFIGKYRFGEIML